MLLDNYILYVKDVSLLLENIDNEKESLIIIKCDDTFFVSIYSYYKKEVNYKNSRRRNIYNYIEHKGNDNMYITTEYFYTKDKKMISYLLLLD